MQGIGGLEETRAGWLRWLFSALLVLSMHAVLLAGLIEITRERESLEEAGAMNIDLPPIAFEATTDQPDNAEDPNDTVSSEAAVEGANTAAPPTAQPESPEAPSPLEPTPIQDAQPETPPEPMPEIEAAPLAPAPEVVLPETAKRLEPTPEPVASAKKPEPPKPKPQKDPKPPAKKEDAGAAAGSKANSKESRAASGGGKFSPNAISRPRPAYPQGARTQKIEGSVVVRYTVNPSGSVSGASIVSASPAGIFNAATIAAVRQWRFKPSASGGSGTTTIRFKLK